jgi:hypothetical protein
MKFGIIYKVLPVVIVLTLILSGIFFLINSSTITANYDNMNLYNIRIAKNTYDSITQEEMKLLKAGLISISSNKEIQDAFVKKDRNLLYNLSKDIFATQAKEVGLTHWVFHTADDVLFLRVHSPELFGEQSSKRYTAKMAMDTQSWGYGLEVGSRGYALRVVAPYHNSTGLIGYIEHGVEITPFLGTMKKQTGDEYAIFGLKSSFDPNKWKESVEAKGLRNNYDDMKEYVLLGSTNNKLVEQNLASFSEDMLKSASDEGNLFMTFSSGSETYLNGGFTLYDGKGEKVGVVVVIRDITSQINDMHANEQKLIFTTIIITIIIALILVILIQMVIIHPIHKLTSAANAIGDGEIYTDIPVFTTNDEIQDLSNSMSTVVEAVRFLHENQK